MATGHPRASLQTERERWVVVSRIYQKTNKAKKRNRLIDICTKKNLKSLFM